MKLTRRRLSIDKDVEKRILTGIIVSDEVLKVLHKNLKPELFGMDVGKRVCQWVLEFYKAYQRAPKTHIQDIFHKEEKNLQEDERGLIEDFLADLSDNYLQEDDVKLNDEYLIDQADTYMRGRGLTQLADNITALVRGGDVTGAEAELSRFSLGEYSTKTSGWVAPLDDFEYVARSFDRSEETLFEFDNALHSIIGPVRRGYLVGLMAPPKRKKTYTAQDIAFLACTSRRRVAFVSLEMADHRISGRFHRQIVAGGKRAGAYTYPVFDCLANQQNNCNNPENLCQVPVPEEYTSDSVYQPCTVCRYKDPKKFQVCTWFTEYVRPKYGRKELFRSLRGFQQTFGKNHFRLISHPARTVNVQNIIEDLDILEYSEGFIPDVIFIDYADILAPEDRRLIGRDAINETWMALRGLANQRKCAVVVPTQSGRASFERKLVTEKDTSEDIRKLAHVDFMLTLNQDEWEKTRGIVRIGILVHRDEEFNKTIQVMMLQNLDVGQPNLDSHIVYYDFERGSEGLGVGEPTEEESQERVRTRTGAA